MKSIFFLKELMVPEFGLKPEARRLKPDVWPR